jgi:hypothetical protein
LTLLLALAWLTLAPALTLGAQSWPTTKFEVFVGSPFIDQTVGGGIAGDLLGPETLDDEDDKDLPHPSAVMELEKALHEAAVWFKNKGLPAPALEPLLKTDEGLVYRIYLCKWHGEGFRCGFNPADGSTSSGMYFPQCAGDPTRSRILYLNRDQTIIGMGLTESGYGTVAHELMHAITANTAFGRNESQNCGSVNRWITEGIPDAIGYDVMEELWKGKYAEVTGGNSVAKRHGYRPYSISLPQDGDLQIPGYPQGNMAQGDYGTSSLWRYIANSHPTGWKNLLTKGSGSSPGLLDTPLTSTSKNWPKEVQWLDAWLHQKFNQRLRDTYAHFVNNFAYRLAPFDSYQGRPAEVNVERWAGILFDQCADVTVPAGGHQDFTLTIQQLAAGCVWVQPTGASGFVQVSFQAGSDDRALLESLTIGLAGTMIVSRAAPIVDISQGPHPHLGAWRDYPQDASTKTLYVISNVSRPPQDSVKRQVTFTVSVPGNKNSARADGSLPPAKVAKRPMKPSYDRKAESLAKQKSATTKMVQEQVNLDKETLNPNVSGATQVRRSVSDPNCREPFKYTACGPHMNISLNVAPGTYLSLAHTSSQGGMAGQMMGSLSAMAQTSAFDSQERVMHLAGLLEGIDGHSVSIDVPMFDYGQAPSFDNAAITVGMANNQSYSAFGPMDETGRSPLTGRVTITEYSPLILSGTFSASLAEYVAGAGPNDPPVYQSRGTVSGTFTSVAPFLGDERATIVHDSHEQMADDIMNSLGVPAGMAQSLREDGSLPESMGGSPGGGSGSSSGGGGTITPKCTCECDMKPFADDLCNLLCEEEFAACE